VREAAGHAVAVHTVTSCAACARCLALSLSHTVRACVCAFVRLCVRARVCSATLCVLVGVSSTYGDVYYFNTITEESSWDRPVPSEPPAPAETIGGLIPASNAGHDAPVGESSLAAVATGEDISEIWISGMNLDVGMSPSPASPPPLDSASSPGWPTTTGLGEATEGGARRRGELDAAADQASSSTVRPAETAGGAAGAAAEVEGGAAANAQRPRPRRAPAPSKPSSACCGSRPS
jgi:hypothetical protein